MHIITDEEKKAAEAAANAPRCLWGTTATVSIRPDGTAVPFAGYANAYYTGRDCAFRALDWTAEREHVKDTSDDEEALLLVARPFHRMQRHTPENAPAYRTSVALYAVPRDGDGTYNFLRGEIGGMFDCVKMARKSGEALDCWIADDYGDVAGVNPLVSRLAGFNKWHPGPAVFAGADDQGRTVSIPSWELAANLAATWRDSVDQIVRALAATKNAEAPALLGANGLELVEFYMRETGPDSPPGFFGLAIDSRARLGAPADLLAACRREEDARQEAARKA